MTEEEKMLEEIEAVSKLPKPWEDCMCNDVAGDNEFCVIHRPPKNTK